MKVSVNDQALFTLNETKKKVICDSHVRADIFDQDMKRRLQWVIMHLYDECYKDFKQKWEPILYQDGVSMIPTDPDAFAELVFNRPDYQDRLQREINDSVSKESL